MYTVFEGEFLQIIANTASLSQGLLSRIVSHDTVVKENLVVHKFTKRLTNPSFEQCLAFALARRLGSCVSIFSHVTAVKDILCR